MKNTINPTQLLSSWTNFEQKILKLLNTLQLDSLNLTCDHVALRVNSVEAADELKQWFSDQGEIISNNMINGRPILIFDLHSPLKLGNFSIECVELPYPSDKVYPQEGWEHIELVLPGGAKTCEQLTEQLYQASPAIETLLADNDQFNIKLSSPKGDGERLANPTIAIKADGICIKIHPHHIRTIIESEQH
ncbi:VOC family protein [Shewanella waksmanii]|uniref:VOC family protein n=1 Tax=Shewanella waksmanii TaxID=213783 RepID=UPI003735ECBE